MKNIILFLGFFLLLFFSCNQKPETKEQESEKTYQELPANKYNAVELNNQVSSIQKASVEMVVNVFRSDTASMSKKLDDAIFELDISINRLISLGETSTMADYFSQSVIALLHFYKSEFEGDFKKLVQILKQNDLSNADKTYLNNYDQDFANKEAQLFEDILVKQDSFASYYQIGLSD